MTLDQSALLEVLDALKAAEVNDRVRQAAETIYQALIEAELTAVIGRRGRSPSSVVRRPDHDLASLRVEQPSVLVVGLVLERGGDPLQV